MNISNSYFFLSLFNPKASGTFSFNFKNYKLEIDVKHSVRDWGQVKFYTHFEVLKNQTKYWEMFIPVKYKCQGLRIIFLKRLN